MSARIDPLISSFAREDAPEIFRPPVCPGDGRHNLRRHESRAPSNHGNHRRRMAGCGPRILRSDSARAAEASSPHSRPGSWKRVAFIESPARRRQGRPTANRLADHHDARGGTRRGRFALCSGRRCGRSRLRHAGTAVSLPADVIPDELRYRGDGWPGEFAVRIGDQRFATSYEVAWERTSDARRSGDARCARTAWATAPTSSPPTTGVRTTADTRSSRTARE